MRVLLAGATGLIGSAIASALSLAGCPVVTLGRAGRADARFDLANAGASDALLPAADALVHAAGIIDEDFRPDPLLAYRKAVAGTQRLLLAAAASGVRRFVYVSSAHVYGPLAGRLDERSPLQPRADYAYCHAAAEALFLRAAADAGGRAVLLRPCAVYGPLAATRAFERWSLIPFAFPRMAKDGRIELASSGLQVRAFVSTQLVAQRALHWLHDAGAGPVVDNVATSQQMRVLDFAQLTAQLAQNALGRPVQVAVPAGAQPPGEAPLDYASLWGTHDDPYPLTQHVQDLIESLRGPHATAND